MSEQLLTILKFALLAVVYLFFFRVLRAVWAEITPPKAATVTPKPTEGRAPKAQRAAPAAAVAAAPGAGTAPRSSARGSSELVVVEPAEQRGKAHPIGNEITIGRASGCGIKIDESYVSQVHARVFLREGNYVVEDLGSTNGTYINRKRLTGPMTMQRGDRLQVGNTVLELA